MSEKNEGGDKTEKPTPKKLRDARREGNVPKSKDLTSTVLVMGWVAGAWMLMGFMGARIAELFERSLGAVPLPFFEALPQLGWLALQTLLWMVLPLMLLALMLGVLVEFLQAGPVATFKKMEPKLDKLNPVEGIKKMFSMDNLIELIKSVVKCAAMIGIGYIVLKGMLERLMMLPHGNPSAMAGAELGTQFAVHGGGSDLVFPHHENEIAQSEAAHGVPLARVWMHNGMIETDSAKMSKSDGNIFQLSEALDRFGAEAVVTFLTSGHYRQPLAFSEDALESARARVARFRNYFAELPETLEPPEPGAAVAEAEETFLAALADDFNTAQAWAVAADLLGAANRGEAEGATPVLARMMHLLGLDAVAVAASGDEPDSEALDLLAEREAARAARDFQRADQIRDQLAERGWEVRDSADGARLVRRVI